MWNVCPACGMYAEDKPVHPAAGVHAFARCQICGADYPFLRLPLFVVSGASGAGKTALALWAVTNHHDCVHIESDILWGLAQTAPDGSYAGYRNMWLRICKNIAQAGKPVVLYGSALPEQWEGCPERRYIGEIHTLALVCHPDTLAERLRARPAWRAMHSSEVIEGMQQFNQWFQENSSNTSPPITLLDTTHISLAESGAGLTAWISERWTAEVIKRQ